MLILNKEIYEICDITRLYQHIFRISVNQGLSVVQGPFMIFYIILKQLNFYLLLFNNILTYYYRPLVRNSPKNVYLEFYFVIFICIFLASSPESNFLQIVNWYQVYIDRFTLLSFCLRCADCLC